MRRSAFIGSLGVLVVAISSASALAETIELVTYYPAPSTPDMHLRSLTVGTPYANENPGDGVALIYDRLGIGTNNPLGPLHVVGYNDQLSSVIFMPGQDTAAAGRPDIFVGIGTTNPQVMLDIRHPQDAAYIRVMGTGDADNFSGLELRSDEATDKIWQIAHKKGGQGGLNDLQVSYNDGAVWNPRVTIQPAGNVGIGTNVPDARLHILGTANATVLHVHQANTVNRGVAYFTSVNPANWIGISDGTTTQPVFIGTIGDAFQVQTGGQGRLNINSVGNVGIGTANPASARMVVSGSVPDPVEPGINTVAVFSSGAANSSIKLAGTNGSAYIGSTDPWGNAYLRCDAGRGIHFMVGSDTKMNMTPSGDFGIGTLGPTAKLHVVGNIYATGSITGNSDLRLKSGVHSLTGVLDKLDAIRGVSFRWNERYRSVGDPEVDLAQTQIGLVAQEVEAVFPELVSSVGEYKAVDYGHFTAVLVEAVKELKAENKRMADEIQVLKRKTERLPDPK